MRPVPLRRRLLLLAGVAILPLALMSGIALRAPVIGSLARGPQGNFGIPVRVPVEREGELRYVLSAIVRPESILQVVSQQRVPDDWIVSVFDAANLRVARSRENSRYMATPPS